ncbi:EAL domain-containing protein [Chromatiaceae bacterium AAb-1]|nr:EAL domain-containing protein [Chromatiaceae bacterium AAb-1]
MKEVNYSKPTGMNSLGLKFSIVVFLATVFAGVLIGYAVMWMQEFTLLSQQQKGIEYSVQRYASRFEQMLQQKEQQVVAVSEAVIRALEQPVNEVAAGDMPQPGDDGSIRIITPDSGAFINRYGNFRQVQHAFVQTGQLWQQLAPLMLQDFSGFYFVSRDHFLRVAPAEPVRGLPASYRFDAFYTQADPGQNPSRLPQWTSAYYSSISKVWVISLLVPVYLNDEFIGITGADYRLTDILADLQDVPLWNQNNNAFLFDQDGAIIGAEQHDAAVYPGASGQVLAEPVLYRFAEMVARNSAQAADISDMLSEQLIAAAPVKQLNWFVAIYASKSDIVSELSQFRNRLIAVFVFVAIVVALCLQFFSYQFILKRLNRLSEGVARLSRGEMDVIQLDSRTDEIGMLNRAFGRMAAEIAELVAGLNARIEEKEQAERAARKLSKAVSFSSSGIVITDQFLAVEYINPFLTEMIGCNAEAFIRKPLNTLFAEEMYYVSTDIVQTLAERQHWRGDILLEYRERQLWVSLAIAPIRDERGEISNYVCAMQDISFIKQSQKQMEQLAYYDVLTGLANRSYFRDQLRKSIAMSQRGYYSFALLYFDLDEFKRINDTLGHDAGDELLKEVARRLIGLLRQEDTIARLGGDEFAIILSGISDREQAAAMTADLQQAFAAPVKLGTHEVSISASIGITVAPEDAAEEEMLLKHADLAMYEAKARGKNTYHFFSNDLNEAAKERLLIENELREAIRENQFRLYFQPKIDIRTETIVGYEALLRWLRPDNVLVPPARFMAVAESTGLIVQIGEWVVLEACRFLSRQHSRRHDVTLSVNLSARQFNDENLPDIVEQILKRTGANPQHLIFEITESMLMGDTDAAINQLNQLKRLGVALSIDDFGTGYSSLNYLKRFPVDELKIDHSFVKDIPEDRNDMDIVAAIIAMAQKMNLRVVAEGVETAEQVEFLRQNTCYQVQGYYFSMPLAEQELSYLNFIINNF